MNIKLTNFEATELIREHFHSKGLHPHVEINSLEIEPVASADFGKKTVELTPLVRAIQNSRESVLPGGSRKIQAIKAVRAAVESQGFFVGLADAKSFVEQFIP